MRRRERCAATRTFTGTAHAAWPTPRSRGASAWSGAPRQDYAWDDAPSGADFSTVIQRGDRVGGLIRTNGAGKTTCCACCWTSSRQTTRCEMGTNLQIALLRPAPRRTARGLEYPGQWRRAQVHRQRLQKHCPELQDFLFPRRGVRRAPDRRRRSAARRRRQPMPQCWDGPQRPGRGAELLEGTRPAGVLSRRGRRCGARCPWGGAHYYKRYRLQRPLRQRQRRSGHETGSSMPQRHHSLLLASALGPGSQHISSSAPEAKPGLSF